MRLLTHPLIAPLCTATADLHAALHALAPLGCVALDGYVATIPADAPHTTTTIYVEGIPRRRPIDAARLVHALAGGALRAMYAPTRDGGRAPLAREVRSAFVDVDAAAARVLLDQWGWDADWMYGAVRGASDAAIDAAVHHFRCMSRATWLARRDEYLAWQRELVAQNAAAAKRAARERRASPPPPEEPLAPPPALFVSIPLTTSTPPTDLRSYFARRVPGAVDYVDVRRDEQRLVLRCAGAPSAARVCAQVHADAEAGIGAPAEVVRGAALQACWAQLPARTQRSALRRASTDSCRG